MNKKIFIPIIVVAFVATIVFSLLTRKPAEIQPEQEQTVELPKQTETEPGVAPHVIINDLRYTPDMKTAVKPRPIMKIPWGSNLNSVGGFLQDKKRVTDGMPWTFRSIGNGKIWILDSVNKALKLFNKDREVEELIALDKMGKNVFDFAFSSDGTFAFLNSVSGEIYLVSAKDKQIYRKLPGFKSARSIEFSKDGDLLLDLPIANGVVKIALDGQLRGIYPSKGDLSNIESINGGLYGLRFKGRKAQLVLRKGFAEDTEAVLNAFDFDKHPEYELWYTGGSVFGKDIKGNVYFNLIVCDKDGIMYSDTIYRCSPDGKILSSMEHIADPELTTGLPRTRIVTPDGELLAGSYDPNLYSISVYTLPASK